MKKLFGLAFLLMMTVSVFGKETPLNITQTEWGFEISNLDAKGKRICKGFLDFQKQENVFIVFKTNEDSFSAEKLANEIVYNNLPNIVVYGTYGTSIEAFKDDKSQMYGPLIYYDSILVLSSAGKIEGCNAYSDGKNLHIKVSSVNKNLETKLTQLINACIVEKARMDAEKKAEEEKIAAEKQIEEIISHRQCNKNENYLYELTETGKIAIIAYIGDSVENLIIPEKIEGLPVQTIKVAEYSYKEKDINGWDINKGYCADSIVLRPSTKFKTVTIPKTVEYIDSRAFTNLEIEKVMFANGSILKVIGTRAFANNKIKEYNIPESIQLIGDEAFYNNEIEELKLPRKEIKIWKNAFSLNKIKKIIFYSGWDSFSWNGYYKGGGISIYSNEKDDDRLYDGPFMQDSDYLEEVFFEDGCKRITGYAFSGCKNLKKISLPSSMDVIFREAFANCTSLSEVTLRGKITLRNKEYSAMSYGVFSGCSSLSVQTKSQLLQSGLRPCDF